MTTAKPPARYRAMEGALAGGIATAELHHHRGRDLCAPYSIRHNVTFHLSFELEPMTPNL
jgi:hypothetical protein